MAKKATSPTKLAKYQSHPAKLEARKRRRKEKWERNRQRWTNDPEYQARQEERSKQLAAKRK